LIITTSWDHSLVFSDFNLNQIKMIKENDQMYYQCMYNSSILMITHPNGLLFYDLDKQQKVDTIKDANFTLPIIRYDNKIYLGDYVSGKVVILR
jgi:hypothetical protein